MMIVPAEEDHAANFALMHDYFEGYCSRMGWTARGSLTVGGVMQAGEVASKPDALEAAYRFGRSVL